MKYVIMDIRLKFKNLFSKYFLFLLLFAHVLLTTSFGYDSAASCSPGQMKMARRGRAQLLATIPCDLSEQAYCNLPGSSYPWHAVRRFVHENQGLMKRMYGDVRHISILRTEIQNNEININDVEAAADRYSRDGGSRNSKYLHSEYSNMRNNDVLMEPHFRPVSTTTTTTTTSTPTSTTTTLKSTSSPGTTTAKPIKQNQHNLDDIEFGPDDKDDDESLQDNSIYEIISEKPLSPSTVTGADNIKVVKSPNLGLTNLSESATISTTLRIVQQIIKADTIEVTDRNDIVDSEEISEESEEKPFIKPNDSFRTTITMKDKPTDQKILNNSPTEPAVKPTNNSADKNKKPIMMDGQLFQDTVQKDPPSVNNLRGVNACPVKEEVVAPFWANNTRGEVLALLNLYPFEQYVHWEKCTNEHKQMYCRDGCRCEQQYRLHRLLAYDPHNECRGIFSDWFRFPSCCICKCYDIPLEFRATSRSPRSDSDFRHPIDLAESEVKKAIYEHATEEWYRPKDDHDFE